MANDSYTQQRLGADPNFQERVRACLMTAAWQVLGEPTNTPDHAQRAQFARVVINSPNQQTQSIATWVVMRPNVMLFETSYNFQAGAIISATGDADITSQLLTDWNFMAGITTGVT